MINDAGWSRGHGSLILQDRVMCIYICYRASQLDTPYPRNAYLAQFLFPSRNSRKKNSKLPWNYVVVLLISPKYYLRQKCWSNCQFSCFRPHPVWESLIFWSLNWWILLRSGQQLSLKYSPFSLKLKCFIRRPSHFRNRRSHYRNISGSEKNKCCFTSK